MSLDFDTTNPEEAQALIQKLELRQKELDTAEKAKENLDEVKEILTDAIKEIQKERQGNTIWV